MPCIIAVCTATKVDVMVRIATGCLVGDMSVARWRCRTGPYLLLVSFPDYIFVPTEKMGSGQLPILFKFVQVCRNAGTLFFSNLMIDISIPHCMC